MAGFLHSKKMRRTKKWKTSGNSYRPEKLSAITKEFTDWFKATQVK